MIELTFTCILLLISYATGKIIEKKHLKRIKEREATYAKFPIVSVGRKSEPDWVRTTSLARGSAVISADYFRSTLAGIVGLLGGHVSVLESVLDRARREARLRMIESVKDADLLLNVRYETSILSSPHERNALPVVEVIAYGTAAYREDRWR